MEQVFHLIFLSRSWRKRMLCLLIGWWTSVVKSNFTDYKLCSVLLNWNILCETMGRCFVWCCFLCDNKPDHDSAGFIHHFMYFVMPTKLFLCLSVPLVPNRLMSSAKQPLCSEEPHEGCFWSPADFLGGGNVLANYLLCKTFYLLISIASHCLWLRC